MVLCLYQGRARVFKKTGKVARTKAPKPLGDIACAEALESRI
jgi:hypothetical protein